ncbi:hypothetical protein DF186_25760, partial [Enterococcus hirae]
AENMTKKTKEKYTRTYDELSETRKKLQSTQNNYAELQKHIINSITDIYKNLKTQIRILIPDVNISLFSMNNIMKND